MFKSVKDFDTGSTSSDEQKKSTSQYNKELKDELEALKKYAKAKKLVTSLISPARAGFFIATGECFKQLPPADDPRNSDDAGSAAGAIDGAER